MQIAVVVITQLIYCILAVVLSLRIINLVQLEGYRVVNSKKMKNIRLKLYGSAICITVCNAIFVLISVCVGNYYLQLISQGLYAVVLLVSLTDERDKCLHQPLVYTARAKRLITTFAIFVVIFVLICGICGHLVDISGIKLSFIFIPLVFALMPEIVALSLAANKPIEKSIANKYIKKCTQTLQDTDIIKIGITGSFGKTTVKNVLTTILNQKYNAYCTPSNFNTPLGICRAVNELPKECQIFVAEMGARKVGDIKELCEIVKPTYGIITGVGSQHLGAFKSQQNIYNTKKELADYLQCVDGAIVFSGENKYTCQMYDEYAGSNKTLISSEGFSSAKEGAQNIFVSDVECDSGGLKFILHIGDEQKACASKLIGRHNLQNILLCVTLAVELGLNIVQIADGIAQITPIEHRLQTIELPTGITIIDDSYNSNEEGAKIAIETLAMFKGRKIVATQGIVEMGDRQQKVNFELGESIAKVADLAIIIGINREDIRLGMLSGNFCDKNIYLVEHLDNAKELFSAMLRKGDVLLLQNDLPDNY
ncbi:MAG: UDP-N-acetylmuramoyl-tripeptide--D-alanyl-D-alanine ligase [Clostridia bacterium]|nr:UDP-N-acetylmuramoyl-tripeptide--D-alanyl-D-alanine ligase [Clostridia bacterium]